MAHVTAEAVYRHFTHLDLAERVRFFTLLAETSARGENYSHEQVFGHLANAELTALEAAEYLEISIATFRRYVADQKIQVSTVVGRSQLFSSTDLKAFKRSLLRVKKPSGANHQAAKGPDWHGLTE